MLSHQVNVHKNEGCLLLDVEMAGSEMGCKYCETPWVEIKLTFFFHFYQKLKCIVSSGISEQCLTMIGKQYGRDKIMWESSLSRME